MKVQLADEQILDAELIYYPKYRSFFRAGACCIELKIEGVGRYSEKSFDYFEALIRLRKELEAKGVKLLCWGARTDVWPSGMQRDMGAGLFAYQLLADGVLNPEHAIFDYASPESVGTIDEQKVYAERWFEKKRGNSR